MYKPWPTLIKDAMKIAGRDCPDYKKRRFRKACKYSNNCQWKAQDYLGYDGVPHYGESDYCYGVLAAPSAGKE